MAKLEVVIIEDDEHIVELLKYNLEENGYSVHYSTNGSEGLELVTNILPDVLLLDLMIPELDGFEVCKRLKQNEQTREVPIIMLTAKGSEMDKVLGLEIGADDYLTKPFSIRELLARVKAVLRRSVQATKNSSKQFKVGNLTVDIDKHEVSRNDEVFQLTYKEFELLKILLENRGRVLTRDELLDAVWGYEYYGETRTVDVHVRHLRKKIETESEKYIETIRGVGYKIK
ncbi:MULTISPECIES: response regulator transcription factor [unclassified Fusibacter]|uniref:response regulator transcription factor n=1 Tax=unclassified Fusibacter TaxID=2624464 RepID=UPI001012BEDD|nr:response regulator transcription factor [Fusibacter sp. A1]MCK8061303.1 response regulator transcription factor [Fusibacter sp. A2]NPE23500.1 response regulator transcription factor [Fusibacter sp. A1]RXV59106.1 DNA-binding response regulator [Fusibacter sp. A1]